MKYIELLNSNDKTYIWNKLTKTNEERSYKEMYDLLSEYKKGDFVEVTYLHGATALVVVCKEVTSYVNKSFLRNRPDYKCCHIEVTWIRDDRIKYKIDDPYKIRKLSDTEFLELLRSNCYYTYKNSSSNWKMFI